MVINNILKSEEENLNSKNSSKQIRRCPIRNTDLEIIGNTEKGYFIALGKYKLTENFTDVTEEDDILELGQYLIEEYKWQIIVNLIAVSTEWAKIDTLNHLEKYGLPGLAETNKT